MKTSTESIKLGLGVLSLLILCAAPTPGLAQATSVKRITRQIPSAGDPTQPTPPVPPNPPAVPARPAPPKANPQVNTNLPPPAPAKSDAEKSELVRKTIESERRRPEAGSDGAQYDLGMRYVRGDGVEKSYAEGRKWLEMSAKQGNETAAKRFEEVKDLKDPVKPAAAAPAKP